MNVRTVDAHIYGGGEDLERIKRQATEVLTYFVAYCQPLDRLRDGLHPDNSRECAQYPARV
jgi:hypothetical protein